MPLTEEQRRALPGLRALFASMDVPFGSAMPFDERARLPETGTLHDITARVQIAPPLSTSFPLLDNSVLKKPERVPVFFYSLRDKDPAPNALEDTRVILYIHGGGNLYSHPTDIRYINLFASMLRALATEDMVPCTIIAPCYRLSTVPENTFPAAVQDLLAAYDFVISQGYKPSNITLAGDSAGGNHALVLMHLVLQSNRPSPSGVVVISPASIQTYDNVSEHAKAQASVDLFSMSMYQLGATSYIGNSGFAPTDSLISGSLISFTESWPRTLILVGTADQLIDASRELERRLAAAKRPVELVEYDGQPHGWWLEVSVFPEEIRDAAQRVTRFVLG